MPRGTSRKDVHVFNVEWTTSHRVHHPAIMSCTLVNPAIHNGHVIHCRFRRKIEPLSKEDRTLAPEEIGPSVFSDGNKLPPGQPEERIL